MIRERGVISRGVATVTGYAGFWTRFAAIVVDGIILGIVGGALVGIFGQQLGNALDALAGWLYFAGMESSEKQATVGKMALGIYVTALNGDRMSFAPPTV